MAFGVKRDNDFKYTSVPADKLNLEGLKVAIVGGTGGLGQGLSRFFCSKGADVTVVGRTFRDNDLEKVQFIKADLELMTEAKRVSEELSKQHLDMVVLSTGIFATHERQVTSENLERDMAVSYLNRLVVLRNLVPALEKTNSSKFDKARVFVFGFPGTGELGTLGDLNSDGKYNNMKAHMNTVAGNEALVLDSAGRYPGVAFFGLNPGLVKTAIRNNFLGEGTWKSRIVESLIGFFYPSTQQYAERVGPMMVSSGLDGHSGKFFGANAEPIHRSQGFTDSYVKKFMAESEALVKKAGVSLE
ncbi:LADA_0B06458g1_1 [Lachancea dasiensis]|uniref:LADA_0B06458g1_1 n=1 Tax=Lachancea dasiensis TaxID=1072105 RepID=A0A1G4IUC1_9SACH|nr:LADA_0B06458g1_1 [Lachancea dasiensis]